MGLVDIPYRGLRSYQRLERWTKSTVSCRTYAWGCLIPTSKFSNGRAGKLCDAQRGTTREICTKGAGRTTHWIPCQASRAGQEVTRSRQFVAKTRQPSLRWRIEKYGRNSESLVRKRLMKQSGASIVQNTLPLLTLYKSASCLWACSHGGGGPPTCGKRKLAFNNLLRGTQWVTYAREKVNQLHV